MASFDFVDVAARGYEFVWKHRTYLARIAFPVVFAKIGCLLLIILMNAQDNILRKELMLMPAYFIEAVFLSGLVRYVLFKEPIIMIGSHAKPPQRKNPSFANYNGHLSQNQCIQTGMIFYLLFKILIAIWQWINTSLQTVENPDLATHYPPTFINMLLVLIILACLVWVLLWLVRLAWIFIPAAQGMPVTKYIKIVQETKIPIFMIATMLLCFVPFGVLFENIKIGAIAVFADQMGLKIITISIIEALDETIIMTICTVAMSYGVHELLNGKKAKKK